MLSEIIAITHRGDVRMLAERTNSEIRGGQLAIRAKIWSVTAVKNVIARIGKLQTALSSSDGVFWTADLDTSALPEGTQELSVSVADNSGEELESRIRAVVGQWTRPRFADVDKENAIVEWSERGLLGTQLGPNKNGRKW